MADLLTTITIDDTSPVISYSPFADTFSSPNTLEGWNPYYTASGFSSGSNSSSVVSNIGNGTSLHLTACDGAQVAIQWNGECLQYCSHACFLFALHTYTLRGRIDRRVAG